MKSIGYYDYEDLKISATSDEHTQKDIEALGAWFDRYGSEYWNGECYEADGLRVYPVICWDDELDQGTVVSYEMK